MKNYYHSSRTDTGAQAVLASVRYQPDCVLGLLLFPGGNGMGVPESSYGSLEEFSDDYSDELGKYQGGVVLSHSPGNPFDLTATIFHYRSPQAYLSAMAEVIPSAPIYYAAKIPGDAELVSDFHNMSDAIFSDYLARPDIKDAIASLIHRGLMKKNKDAHGLVLPLKTQPITAP